MKRNPTRLLPRFRRSEDGNAAIEFAFVAPVFFFLTLGIIEIGLITFYSVVLESATNSSVRNIRTGFNPSTTGQSLEQYVRENLRERASGLMNTDRIFITTETGSFSEIVPDICLMDEGNPFPATCDPGPHIENNGQEDYQQGAEPALSVGVAGDTIRLQTFYRWESLTGFEALIGAEPKSTVLRSVTFIKNEPSA